MGAHSGRCFRAWRRTKVRKARQGLPWDYPIRQKVPQALRAFLATGDARQQRVGAQGMANAIARYAQHQTLIGKVHKASPRGR